MRNCGDLFKTFFFADRYQRVVINVRLIGDKKMTSAFASCRRLSGKQTSAWLVMLAVMVSCQQAAWSQEAAAQPQLQPLPAVEDVGNPKQVELGRMLFFDGRLSGDATVSCSTCHQPDLAWSDGLPMAAGYPGSLNFRNTPSLLNVAQRKFAYWDGRLPVSDLPTIVRDHISEAHFMQADGRLVIERLKQVPAYRQRFEEAFGGEPSYGRILGAVGTFVRTLHSTDAPVDQYLRGQEEAISEIAKRGLVLFRGAGKCVECHHGALLTDEQFHNTGVPANPQVFAEPLRHITFRRFFRTLGVSEYGRLRHDPGLYGVTKQDEDRGRFRTPSLREVSRTAPYMHNGVFKTLDEVVAFYNRGGGDAAGKEPRLKPLGLSEQQQADLVEFLKTLASPPEKFQVPDLPEYELIKLGVKQ